MHLVTKQAASRIIRIVAWDKGDACTKQHVH